MLLEADNMKKNLIRGAIALAIIIIVGGTYLFISNLFFPKDNTGGISGIIAEMKDNPTPEQLAIINADFLEEDTLMAEDVKTERDVYDTIHMMANSKIIAGDGMIWGLRKITKNRVEQVQKAIQEHDITDPRIVEMLNRWINQDFSQCVQDHNYIWEVYLNGQVGKAVRLR
jgi:hypothetical protein